MTTSKRPLEDYRDVRVHSCPEGPGGDRRPPVSGAEGPRFYTVAQVAGMFGMAPVTLYRAIRGGQFPAVRIRGRLIVPAKAVDAIVDAAVADSTLTDLTYLPEEGGHR